MDRADVVFSFLSFQYLFLCFPEFGLLLGVLDDPDHCPMFPPLQWDEGSLHIARAARRSHFDRSRIAPFFLDSTVFCQHTPYDRISGSIPSASMLIQSALQGYGMCLWSILR